MGSEKMYGWLRTAGLLAVIPIVLATGPLGGYLAADFMVSKFHLPGYTIMIGIVVGFIASLRETIKIIRLAIKSEASK